MHNVVFLNCLPFINNASFSFLSVRQPTSIFLLLFIKMLSKGYQVNLSILCDRWLKILTAQSAFIHLFSRYLKLEKYYTIYSLYHVCIKKTDTFELWCWRRLLRVPGTARRSNQSILKKINPEYSLEGLMLKLQSFGHLMGRTDSLEKTLTLGKTEDKMRRRQQRTR